MTRTKDGGKGREHEAPASHLPPKMSFGWHREGERDREGEKERKKWIGAHWNLLFPV